MSKMGRELLVNSHPISHGQDFNAPLRAVYDQHALAQGPFEGRPKAFIANHIDGYAYLTEQFVVKDFDRLDLIRLVNIISTDDISVIKKVGDRCKSLGHFNIAYLAGALENESGEAIEEIRRENRIEASIVATPRLKLPGFRPLDISVKLDVFIGERKIDDALRGKNG